MTLLFVTVFAYGNSNECLKYEPTVVQLLGTIEIITYPGPPNYEDIKAGDIPEACAFLVLESPICVADDSKSDINTEREVNQSRVQLVPSDSVRNFKTYADGKRYRLAGTLFHAFTGHHRAAILMVVKTIEVVG